MVHFRTACANIPQDAVVIEVGPQPVLRAPLRQNRPDLKLVVIVKKDRPAAETLGDAVTELWTSGVPVKWDSQPPPQGQTIAEGLPISSVRDFPL